MSPLAVGIKTSHKVDPCSGYDLGEGLGLCRVWFGAAEWVGGISISVEVVEDKSNLKVMVSMDLMKILDNIHTSWKCVAPTKSGTPLTVTSKRYT